MISWSTAEGSVPVRSSTSRITRAPRSTAGTEASPPPSFPNGVRAAATTTTSVGTVCLQNLVGTQQVARDQDALHLAGSLADFVYLDVAIEAGHRRLLHESHAAVDLDGLIGARGGDLGGVQLRHRRIGRGALSGVDRCGRAPGHQPRQLDLRAHVGELELGGLEGGNRDAELMPRR